MTCKKKRLKCDETKPSCVQCQKRSVLCEGYKKDYKWRTFEETTFATRPTTKRKSFRSNSFSSSHHTTQPLSITVLRGNDSKYTDFNSALPPQTWSPGIHAAFATVHEIPQSRDQSLTSSPDEPENAEYGAKGDFEFGAVPSPPLRLTPESLFTPPFEGEGIPADLVYGEAVDPFSLTKTISRSSANDDNSAKSLTSDSPKLLDLFLANTEVDQPHRIRELHQPMGLDADISMEEDFDEEIIRSDAIATSASMQTRTPSSLLDPLFSSTHFQAFRKGSPTPSEASTASSKSSGMTLLAQPTLDASSPEMLMLRFDKQTCGILSIKDGPTENPWRTLIWPLARESPALYHAISSMTAFHGAHEIPHLHVPGVAHMTKSIKRLASEIENMRLDSALATSLALAFGEGWDSHVSTGIQHLHGARIMVNNAVVKHRRDMQLGQMTTEDANRLKFLCNTFVYMDVIARLTSREEAQDLNFEEILTTVNTSYGHQIEVDPLMGCATTLFPLIGRVAKLIQRVRRTETNSPTVVSTALELKEQLLQWEAPNVVIFERPEDPSSEVSDSVQTAEAYRYATLLHLHQAVPEIPSDPAFSLAKKVLVTLASVPLSSRTTIVQIFPLFVASCEVTDPEDRSWVTQRWAAMITRLKLGNVVSCWNVVQEVWNRRDEYEAEKESRLMRQYASRGVPGGNFVRPVMDMSRGPKRKANTIESIGNTGTTGPNHFQALGQQSRPLEDMDAIGRPFKRRLTIDGMGSSMLNMSVDMPPISLPRRQMDDIVSPDRLQPEYTVRGRLHWLRVMDDWDWEGMLSRFLLPPLPPNFGFPNFSSQ